MPTVFNRKAAAKELGVSVETLDRYKDNGKLPYRKIGKCVRFTESDLMTFLDNCAVSATRLPSGYEMTAKGMEVAREHSA